MRAMWAKCFCELRMRVVTMNNNEGWGCGYVVAFDRGGGMVNSILGEVVASAFGRGGVVAASILGGLVVWPSGVPWLLASAVGVEASCAHMRGAFLYTGGMGTAVALHYWAPQDVYAHIHTYIHTYIHTCKFTSLRHIHKSIHMHKCQPNIVNLL